MNNKAAITAAFSFAYFRTFVRENYHAYNGKLIFVNERR